MANKESVVVQEIWYMGGGGGGGGGQCREIPSRLGHRGVLCYRSLRVITIINSHMGLHCIFGGHAVAFYTIGPASGTSTARTK